MEVADSYDKEAMDDSGSTVQAELMIDTDKYHSSIMQVNILEFLHSYYFFKC